MGVLYVLDEPSIGLHQRDNRRLIATLERLRDLGNSVIVVEHDEETIRLADFIVDIGPGAGEFGGRVVHAGTYKELLENTESLTGQYLSGEKSIPIPDDASHGRRQEADHQGRAGEQPAEPHRRRARSGTSSPSPASRARASRTLINGILLASLERQINRAKTTTMPSTTRSPASRTSTRSSRSTSSRSAARRARTRRRTRGLRQDPQALRRHPGGQGPRATSRAASPST